MLLHIFIGWAQHKIMVQIFNFYTACGFTSWVNIIVSPVESLLGGQDLVKKLEEKRGVIWTKTSQPGQSPGFLPISSRTGCLHLATDVLPDVPMALLHSTPILQQKSVPLLLCHRSNIQGCFQMDLSYLCKELFGIVWGKTGIRNGGITKNMEPV